MGSTFSNVFGLSLGIGLNSGLDTLVSQANGAGNFRKCGIHFQQAVVVSTLICIPASLILFFTQDILLLLGQSADVAVAAGLYVRATLLSLWPMYMTNAMSGYLRAQMVPNASFYVQVSGNAFHVFSCYLFIFYLSMGATGAGLAVSLTNWFSCICLFLYIVLIRPGGTKESWVAWDWAESTSGLMTYIKVSLPCAALIWTEWWCTEVMMILAGLLGTVALAAHVAVTQIFTMAFMLAGGIASAAAALVGNAIGAGNSSDAKRSAAVSSAAMMVVSAILCTAVIVLQDVIADFFSKDPEVQDLIHQLLKMLILIIVLDCVQTVIDGVLRGLGKQATAFQIKVVCMWCIRVPGAAFFAFQANMGIVGIYYGSTLGLLATMVAYIVLLARIDWNAEAERCSGYQKMANEEEAKKENAAKGGA